MTKILVRIISMFTNNCYIKLEKPEVILYIFGDLGSESINKVSTTLC